MRTQLCQMEKKGKNTLAEVMKMLNLKNNPIMTSKAQDILFVSNAGMQMKHTERKLWNVGKVHFINSCKQKKSLNTTSFAKINIQQYIFV